MGNLKPSLRVKVGDRDYGHEEKTKNESVRAHVLFNNEGKSEELGCPFCPEDFDVIELCCHIDADHCVETKPGICPLCRSKVGVNMVEHLLAQHERDLKHSNISQNSLTQRQCMSKSAKQDAKMALMRKQFQDNFSQLIRQPPRVDSSTPGYLSFSNINPQRVESYNASLLDSSSRSNLPQKSDNNDRSERIQPRNAAADIDKNNTKRCEFLQELVLSTFQDEF